MIETHETRVHIHVPDHGVEPGEANGERGRPRGLAGQHPLFGIEAGDHGVAHGPVEPSLRDRSGVRGLGNGRNLTCAVDGEMDRSGRRGDGQRLGEFVDRDLHPMRLRESRRLHDRLTGAARGDDPRGPDLSHRGIARGPLDSIVDPAIALGRHHGAEGVHLIRAQPHLRGSEGERRGLHRHWGGRHQPGRARLDDGPSRADGADHPDGIDRGDVGGQCLPGDPARRDRRPVLTDRAGAQLQALSGEQGDSRRLQREDAARGDRHGVGAASGDQHGHRGTAPLDPGFDLR